ncbi:MAG: O-antigen/teichoic acid export membrane protein [Urechidicola sp.]|jgi:O-antigen/teichoic acid export membrane protein
MNNYICKGISGLFIHKYARNKLKLRKSTFLKDVSILSIGTIISQLINIGGLPFLTRLYNVEEFGNLALFMAFGSIVFSFSTLKLDLAIVKTEKRNEKMALIGISFIAIFFLSILATLCLFIWSFWNPQVNSLFLFLMFLFFIANGGSQVLVYFFSSEKIYQNITFAKVLLAIVNLIFALLLFYWDSSLGLIFAITLANIFSFLGLGIFFRKEIPSVFKIEKTFSKQILYQNINFIKFSTPASFLDILSYQIIIIILSVYYSEEITGSFFMSMRVVLLPSALIGAAIGQVFYKEMSDKFSNNNLTKNDFWDIWKVLFLIGIIPFVIFLFFGKTLFVWALGDEWMLAGEMAIILVIKGFFNFLSSPTSSGFVVINKQHYNLILTTIRITYTIILLWVSILRNDIFVFLRWYTFFEIIQMLIYNFLMLNHLPPLKTE